MLSCRDPHPIAEILSNPRLISVLEPVKTLVLMYNTSVSNLCSEVIRLVSISNFTVMQVQVLVITVTVKTSKM